MTSSDPQRRIRIDIWSDYVCPFCYLQLPALARLRQTQGEPIDIHWRAFELRPDPHPTLDPAGEYLRSTWAKSVYPMAAERGMTLKLPPVQPRSRKAMEAAAHAALSGQFDRMHEALFRAFFQDGLDIGRTDVLVDIGNSIGLDADDLRAALDGDRHTAHVLEDERLAQGMGISGVPIMLLRVGEAPWEDAIALSGAVPYEHIEAAVAHLRKEQDVV